MLGWQGTVALHNYLGYFATMIWKKKFVRILTELDKKKGEIRQSGFKRTCTSSANYWVKLHKCVSEVWDQQMVSLLSSFW